MTLEYILLDMDGVLCDWVGGVCEMFGRDPARVKAAWPKGTRSIETVLGVSRELIWRRIEGKGAAFWEGLPPEPWASELWTRLNQIAPTVIFTSPGLHPSGFSGKISWLRSWRTKTFRQYMLGPHKHLAAKPGYVLVDDWEVATQQFQQHGGEAILFPQPWNAALGDWTDVVERIEEMAK